MIANLQALRALAAIAVVIFHVGLMPATALLFPVGAAGVDIFFVLSGFIIAHSASRDARRFLARRLIRILPPYWIATIIAALFTLQALNLREAADWLVQSLFYLPGPGGRPVLIFVAWTLVFELAFYLVYWLALRTGPRRAPVVTMAMLVPLAVISLPGLPGPWPLFLEFGLGIGVYLATERLGGGRPGRSAGLLLVAAGLVLMPILPGLVGYRADDHQSLERVMAWGVPAGFLVLGAVIAERSGFAIRNRMVLLLGAASYAIYLLHPVGVGQLMQLPPNAPPLSWAMCFAAVVAMVAVSVVFYRFVEAPLLRAMRRWIGDSR